MLRLRLPPGNLSNLTYNMRVDRENKTLLDRIEAFDVDGGPRQLSFAARLARENNWTVAYAERVIGEYKRFAFLTMAAGHPCTPSDQVDQAWHLHLTYTKSYWERFCGGVLPRPLHHNPTQGGNAENTKFDDWYARTLESYERFFGHLAPADIWPPATVRFGDDIHFTRVNTRRNWIVPKRRFGLAAGALAVLAVAGGCTGQEAVLGLSIVLAGFLILGLLAYALSGGARKGNARNDGSGCSAATSGCGSTSTSDGGGWFGGWFGGGSNGDSSGCGGGDGGGGGCGGGCGGGGD